MLSDAIAEFLTYRKSAGYRPNTLLVDRRSLSKFLAQTGNIQVSHLDARHGEQFQSFLMGQGYKPNTVNSHLNSLAVFVKWLRTRRYLGAASDPTANVRAVRTIVEPRQRVLREDFDRFLDTCKYPWDRMVCALGLYLFLRASEIQGIRLKDIDLDRGEILVHIEKTQTTDTMPISEELDAELRRWLTFYANDVNKALEPEMYLVPRVRRPTLANDGRGPGGGYQMVRARGNLQPHKRASRPHRYVQRTLVAFGMPIRGEDGKSLNEGVHTLRRSGARALFDELVERGGYDGVLRLVAAMLHHKSTIMTERYLGLDVDVKKRNDTLRGSRMFAKPDTSNVVSIESVFRSS